MHQEREDLDILFRRTSPEIVLEHIRTFGRCVKEGKFVPGVEEYTQSVYEHYAPMNFGEYTLDEVEMRYQALREKTGADKMLIFHALVRYADKRLELRGAEPICRLERILDWNSMTKRLGQDLFITGWLAWNDVKKGVFPDWRFDWPTVIKTDDRRLEVLFQKGLAENHFHLNGSTQVFSLSWACLMNHPVHIGSFLRRTENFRENLSMRISRGTMDNVMSYPQRILYAAAIRAYLTRRCMEDITGLDVWREFQAFDDASATYKIAGMIEALRMRCGTAFEQPNHKYRCLDYANSDYFYSVDTENCNRLSAGERSFLYQCFRRIFQREFTLQESSLFYLYLLIKSNFMGELIQNNGRPGFKNFSDYQDRKSECFGALQEYVVEAERLAVRTSIEDNHLVFLEARIMPKKTALIMRNVIKRTDKMIRFADRGRKEWPYYYVIHFPKNKFTTGEYEKTPFLLLPRNHKTRRSAKAGAIALAKYMRRCEMIRQDDKDWPDEQRIFGIDACSKEIGCRPETFATEFRFLRECSQNTVNIHWYQEPRKDYISLGVTYHVGEDYLDLMDGLRAIDEAIQFLEMKKGDRLGHAIALGLDAKTYYALKRWSVYLPKQDYLDNLVWMLYRSLELGVPIEANFRSLLIEKARDLLVEIYGGETGHMPPEIDGYGGELLDIYFYSWRLRTDHPDLYKTGRFVAARGDFWDSYEEYKKGDASLDKYRKIDNAAGFLYLYHFDPDVKTRGLQPTGIEWENWKDYIDLVDAFQHKLRTEIARKGIAIECNPTSNVLISTFSSYDRHPILNFNRYRLENDIQRANIQVSINTDDLGVFDTSIENEYALLLCAIRRARHNAGNYNDDAIYDYLDYIRECGIQMAFKRR